MYNLLVAYHNNRTATLMNKLSHIILSHKNKINNNTELKFNPKISAFTTPNSKFQSLIKFWERSHNSPFPHIRTTLLLRGYNTDTGNYNTNSSVTPSPSLPAGDSNSPQWESAHKLLSTGSQVNTTVDPVTCYVFHAENKYPTDYWKVSRAIADCTACILHNKKCVWWNHNS